MGPGVEHQVVLLRTAAGRTWQLVGPRAAEVPWGSDVTVGGHPDDPWASGYGQQGTRFVVDDVPARHPTGGADGA